jgi:hypothetical protein
MVTFSSDNLLHIAESVDTLVWKNREMLGHSVTRDPGGVMSRNELTEAYVRGRISRRSFVRGMVALGASMTAAIALADNLQAAPSGVRSLQASADVYPEPPKKDDVYPEPPPKTTGGAPVAVLPATGSGDGVDNGPSVGTTVVAAGAAAAAMVALRMRQNRKAGEES